MMIFSMHNTSFGWSHGKVILSLLKVVLVLAVDETIAGNHERETGSSSYDLLYSTYVDTCFHRCSERIILCKSIDRCSNRFRSGCKAISRILRKEYM